jgi:hypothetical protein
MFISFFSAVLDGFHMCNFVQYSLKQESSHNPTLHSKHLNFHNVSFYVDHISLNDGRGDSHYLTCVTLNGHDTLYNATDEI